jgi:hypothetical protein
MSPPQIALENIKFIPAKAVGEVEEMCEVSLKSGSEMFYVAIIASIVDLYCCICV